VALSRREFQQAQIWLMERARPTQLTFPLSIDLGPGWSPDGGRIGFSSMRDSTLRLVLKASNGTDARKCSCSQATQNFPPNRLATRFLLYCEVDAKTKADLWVQPLQQDVPHPVRTHG
jgi:Tol biopolymer transport system component